MNRIRLFSRGFCTVTNNAATVKPNIPSVIIEKHEYDDLVRKSSYPKWVFATFMGLSLWSYATWCGRAKFVSELDQDKIIDVKF